MPVEHEVRRVSAPPHGMRPPLIHISSQTAVVLLDFSAGRWTELAGSSRVGTNPKILSIKRIHAAACEPDERDDEPSPGKRVLDGEEENGAAAARH